MMTQANGEYSPEPCRASGSIPPMAVIEVSRMGRKRGVRIPLKQQNSLKVASN